MKKEEINVDGRTKQDLLFEVSSLNSKLSDEIVKNENLQQENQELKEESKKQKEVIDDCKEDISNLLDIINKNCNELKCTSDEWLVIQKYQDKEVK